MQGGLEITSSLHSPASPVPYGSGLAGHNL